MTGITCWIHGRGRSYFDNVARQLRRQRVEEEAARRSAESSELREVYLFSSNSQKRSSTGFCQNFHSFRTNISTVIRVFKLNVCKDIFSNGTALKKKEPTSCMCYFCILLAPLLTLKVDREENQRLRHYSPSNGWFHISHKICGQKQKT